MDKLSLRIGRLALGLTALITIALVACGETTDHTVSEAETSVPETQQEVVGGETIQLEREPPAQTAGILEDLTDILESEIQVVDITSNSARVIAQTTIDVACAVAFGTTTDYGSLAVDSDMGGGGHADHGPQLTGLEPDTIYHLTLAASAPMERSTATRI